MFSSQIVMMYAFKPVNKDRKKAGPGPFSLLLHAAASPCRLADNELLRNMHDYVIVNFCPQYGHYCWCCVLFSAVFHLHNRLLHKCFCRGYNNPFAGHPLLAWHWVFMAQNEKNQTYTLYFLCQQILNNMVPSSPDFPSVPIQWQGQGTHDKEPQQSFPLCELCVFVTRGLHCWHFAQRWLQLDRQRKSHSNDRQLIKPVTKQYADHIFELLMNLSLPCGVGRKKPQWVYLVRTDY